MCALINICTNFHMEKIAKIDFSGNILETVIRHKLYDFGGIWVQKNWVGSWVSKKSSKRKI